MEDPEPPWASAERVEHWQAGGQVGDDRLEHRWYGRDRWRNHWHEEPAADDEPAVGATRQDDFDMADQIPSPGDMPTRADYVQPARAPRAAGDWTDHSQIEDYPYDGRPHGGQTGREHDNHAVAYDDGGLYASDGFRVQGYQDEDSRDARRGTTRRTPGGPASAPAPAVPPGTGGAPLTWDEDE